MSDDYLQSLRLEGRHPEADDLERDRADQQETLRRFASETRAQGYDVTYRADGGVEFKLPSSKKETKTVTKNPHGEQQTLYNPSQGGSYQFLFWFLRLMLLLVLIGVVFRNIEPYAQWSQQWFGSDLQGWWTMIPGATWMADKIFRFLGIVLWALFQTLETIPLLLLGTRFGLGVLIASYQQQDAQKRRIDTYPTDDAVLVFLKKKYNALGLRALDFFRMASPFAYCVDLIVCWQIFPPLKDGYTWSQVILGWNFGGISWGNVISLVVTLLAFEMVVLVWLRTSEMLFLIRRGIKNV